MTTAQFLGLWSTHIRFQHCPAPDCPRQLWFTVSTAYGRLGPFTAWDRAVGSCLSCS